MKIVISLAVVLLLIGCNDSSEKVVAQTPAVTPVVEKVVEEKSMVSSMLDSADSMAKQAQDVASSTADKAVETTKDVVQSTKEAVSDTVDVVSDKVETVVSTKTGADLYKTCAGCHGQMGEKAALGKSEVIHGWSASKITDALNGYKDGTYGGAMKGVMAGQAKNLSEYDIKLLAEYISTMG